MELLIEKNAVRALSRMQPKIAAAIVQDLRKVAVDPFASYPNVKRLRGDRSFYPLRHGDWRALYRVDAERQQMIVELVVSRGSAYR
jgi:mRNA interferase RelE/StbE